MKGLACGGVGGLGYCGGVGGSFFLLGGGVGGCIVLEAPKDASSRGVCGPYVLGSWLLVVGSETSISRISSPDSVISKTTLEQY